MPKTAKGKVVPAAITAIGQFRRLPLGALLGLTVAGAIHFAMPDVSPGGWMEAPFALFCAACGILLERTFDKALGWFMDARFRHLAAWYEARLEMQKLRRYEKDGVLNQMDVRRIAARIARRDVAGGPGPKGKPRGPYRKKQSDTVDPAPTPAEPEAKESHGG